MDEAVDKTKGDERCLFLVSLLMPLTALVSSYLVAAQWPAAGYFAAPLLGMALLGAASGLSSTSEPLAGRRALLHFVFLLALLAAVRVAGVSQLGIIPDSSTYFTGLVFLGWHLGQELLVTALLAAIYALTFAVQRNLARQLRGCLDRSAPVRSVWLGCAAGCALYGLSIALPAQWPACLLLAGIAWAWLCARSRKGAVLSAAVLVFAGLFSSSPLPGSPAQALPGACLFSPYQQLSCLEVRGRGGDAATFLSTAGGGGQSAYMGAAGGGAVAKPGEPDWFVRLREKYAPQSPPAAFYAVPYLVHPRPARVLVLGAGIGNDVRAALDHGAGRVEAVEIDPAVALVLRRRFAAEMARGSVAVHEGDARQFLAAAKSRYDLILVARLDAPFLSSPLLPQRASDAVFSPQAFRLMSALLADGGHLAVSASLSRRWASLRIIRNMREAFRIIDGGVHVPGGQYLVTTNEHPDDLRAKLGGAGGMAPDTIALNEESLAALATSDDWPYMFVQTRAVPLPYLWMLYVALAVTLVAFRRELCGFLEEGGEVPGSFRAWLAAFSVGFAAACLAAWLVACLIPAAGATFALTPALLSCLALAPIAVRAPAGAAAAACAGAGMALFSTTFTLMFGCGLLAWLAVVSACCFLATGRGAGWSLAGAGR